MKLFKQLNKISIKRSLFNNKIKYSHFNHKIKYSSFNDKMKYSFNKMNIPLQNIKIKQLKSYSTDNELTFCECVIKMSDGVLDKCNVKNTTLRNIGHTLLFVPNTVIYTASVIIGGSILWTLILMCMFPKCVLQLNVILLKMYIDKYGETIESKKELECCELKFEILKDQQKIDELNHNIENAKLHLQLYKIKKSLDK